MPNAFVGHGYHKVTSSSKWFIEMLQAHDELHTFWDDSWRGQKRIDIKTLLDFDRVFVWQVEYIAKELAELAPEKVVFIPMLDGVRDLHADWWSTFRDTRILSFSWTLHERLRKWGRNSFHTQYFPDPSKFSTVTNFDTLRGYLWQRRPEISLDLAEQLSRGSNWDHFRLHIGMDPTYGEAEAPNRNIMRRMNVEVSFFSEDPSQVHSQASQANVYFTPRSSEGIGMTFLEAMARGQCVVSPNAPTMSEYLEHDVTGLLYNLETPRPLDFCRAKEIGAAARRYIEHGFEDWSFDLSERLPAILFERSGFRPPRTRAQAEWNNSPALDKKQNLSPDAPLITVAIVTLNAEEAIEDTLLSIIDQTFSDMEIIVVDGASTDGTHSVIERYKDYISAFVSEPDNGAYDAMNKAVKLARGKYIIFMNAGDLFSSKKSIERTFRHAPSDSDFVYGHHIYLSVDGAEEFHHAAIFSTTYAQLSEGKLSWKWLAGVPGHQATFTRRQYLLDNNGYNTDFQIAADHEFMYRAASKGAKFHHCGETLAIYAGGGFSYQRQKECAQEWWKIARLYGERKGVDRFFRAGFPSSYEIDPWSIDVVFLRLKELARIDLKKIKMSIKKANRRRIERRRQRRSQGAAERP